MADIKDHPAPAWNALMKRTALLIGTRLVDRMTEAES